MRPAGTADLARDDGDEHDGAAHTIVLVAAA
jgi:hypothetical protein